MNVRRFEVNMSCASCANRIMKKLKQFPDVQYSLNPMEQMMTIEADETKYSDEMIVAMMKEIGYIATRI